MEEKQDLQALRARLLELHGAVKGYFEATTVGYSAGYWSAFDALRRNQHLAQAFVGELQALLEFLERELAPALSPATGPTGRTSPGASPMRSATQAPPNAGPSVRPIHEDETMLLSRLPDNVQAEAARLVAARSARSTPDPAPRTRPPAATSSVEIDDGDTSLLQEIEDNAPAGGGASGARPRDNAPAGGGASGARSQGVRSQGPAPPAPPQKGGGETSAARPSASAPAASAQPSPPRAAGALSARIAAVTGSSSPPATQKQPAPGPRPASRLHAARSAPGEPVHPAPKQSGRHRVRQLPQFDESDVTDPSIPSHRIPPSGRKR
ncbi:MAG: hypothetical protein NZ890_13415 [Myxococcota bacterium]|nr:hypothetical protein [Myxococcota bacterium]